VPKLIKEIDAIEAELKYLPEWQVKFKNQKLEELRQELYEAKLSSKADDEELAKRKKLVSEYVEKNNLAFAKKWGW
jgi:ABC-type phosphate transport system auxiliary subunit